MVVLQALSEYMISRPPPADLSLNVDLRMTGRKELRYHFNPDTAYAARSSKASHTLSVGGKRMVKIIALFVTEPSAFAACLSV